MAVRPGDRSPRSPTSYSDSKQSLSRDESVKIQLNDKPFVTEKPYRCTFPSCDSKFGSMNEWKMHEEGHWAPTCYICLFCATIRQDSTGDQICIWCSHRFDSHFTVDVAGSHILQCELARGRSQNFASYDDLCTHLRTRHDIKDFDLQSTVCSFPVESSWPKECDFCGTKFSRWDERADHIGAHFRGADKISEVPLHLFNMENKISRDIAKHGALLHVTQHGNFVLTEPLEETTRYYPGHAWNTTCLAKPSMSNIRFEGYESSKGIAMTFPDDCPAVVTDTTVGQCSCTGGLPSTTGEQIRLRCVSRALHVSRTKLLLKSTGEWLWFTDEFQKWRNLHEHSFFWLCGSPGSGKSILTSAVIRHLEKGDKRKGEVVAFYCYDGRYESSDTVLHIMGVWLAELQARRRDDATVARLMGDVVDLNSTHERLSRAVLRSVFQTIKHNLEEGEVLILVLDGLDDVQIGHDLLQELLTLTRQHDKNHRIKIFISCRREFATNSSVETPFQIDVDSQTSIVHDMEDYTDSIVSKGLATTCDAEMVTRIRKITEKSQGRFLCMRLLLFMLSHESASVGTNKWVLSITNDEGIKSPITIYDYMSQSISEVHHRFAFCMLSWVLHAARPMYSWELLEAVNSELGTNYLDTEVEQSTMGLLTISRTRTVNLIHLSLRDHLITIDWSSILQEDPYEMIARACLRALDPELILQRVNPLWSDDYVMHIKSKPSQTLEIYAEKYWIHHYLLAEPQSTWISGLLHETLRKMILSRKTKPEDDSKLDSKAPKTLLGIEIARLEPASLDVINMVLQISASLGFYELAKLELDMGATDHIISGFPENSLHLATIGGHTRVVKLLIDYGADVSSLCKLGDTPAFHAIASGNHEVMELLLKSGPSAAAAALASGATEELRLEPDISKQCSICGQSKISFIVSFSKSLSSKLSRHAPTEYT